MGVVDRLQNGSMKSLRKLFSPFVLTWMILRSEHSQTRAIAL